MENGNEIRTQSEFNMSVSYLNRLNNLFYLCDNAAISLDVFTWFHSLLALFRELSTELKSDEIKTYASLIEELNPIMSKYIQGTTRGITHAVPNDLYNKLHNFELKLRTVMKESGLLLKIMDNASKALR